MKKTPGGISASRMPIELVMSGTTGRTPPARSCWTRFSRAPRDRTRVSWRSCTCSRTSSARSSWPLSSSQSARTSQESSASGHSRIDWRKPSSIAGGSGGRPRSGGLAGRRASLGEGGDEVEDRPQLRQPHAVAVEEILQREVAAQGVLVAEPLGEVADELAVTALQVRQGAPAALGQVGELAVPAGQEGAPPGAHVVGGGGAALVGELFALHFEDLAEQLHDLGGGAGGVRRLGRGGGARRDVDLEVHGVSPRWALSLRAAPPGRAGHAEPILAARPA